MSSLTDLLIESLAAVKPKKCDKAVAELALTYARGIEAGGDLTRLGPALLATLEALHLSPRARGAGKGMTSEQPTVNPLDQLAERRAGRGRASGVDAATP